MAGRKVNGIEVGGGPITDADAIHVNVAAEIQAVTEKAAPYGADIIILEDSSAAHAKKKGRVDNIYYNGGYF